MVVGGDVGVLLWFVALEAVSLAAFVSSAARATKLSGEKDVETRRTTTAQPNDDGAILQLIPKAFSPPAAMQDFIKQFSQIYGD